MVYRSVEISWQTRVCQPLEKFNVYKADSKEEYQKKLLHSILLGAQQISTKIIILCEDSY